ncbi:MAG: hypothetical protein ACREF4_07475 [Gammaproteobacteria bacterium]
MSPVLLDTRPPGVNASFRPGTTRMVTLEWPAGSLAGRTFTSTLDGVALSLVTVDDTQIITVTDTQTAAHAEGTSVDWLLLEDIGGTDEPVMIGTWTASNRPAATASQALQVVTGGATTVDVTVVGGVDLPEIASSDPAKVPITTVGGVTTIDVELTVPEVAFLTADLPAINNSVTAVNLTGLAVPVAANAVYMVMAYMFYVSTTVADIAWSWTAPGGVSGRWNAQGIASTATVPGDVIATASTTWGASRVNGGAGASVVTTLLVGTLITGGTAGTLQLRASQNTAEATNTIPGHAGSILTAQRVA